MNNQNSINYDNQHGFRKNLNFSDNSWRSDDDEDYSLNEDLELNFKTVKLK